MDQKFQICRLDQCIHHKNYCLNNGLCMNNPNVDTINLPLCICSSNYKGLRCELKNPVISSIISENSNNSIHHNNLLNMNTTMNNIEYKTKNQKSKLIIHSNNQSIISTPFIQYPFNSITTNKSLISSTISPIVSYSEIVIPINSSKTIHEQVCIYYLLLLYIIHLLFIINNKEKCLRNTTWKFDC